LRIYNLGIEKTGTTSIAGIFGNYNSVHEYSFSETIHKIYDWKNNIINRNDFVDYINNREERRKLPVVDSSSFNHYYADILLEKFSDAKFILTIRNIESWFASDINMIYNYYAGFQNSWRKKYFNIRTDSKYNIFPKLSKKSEIKNHLTQILLNTDMIKDFLRYYYDSNLKIVNLIPSNKLLIINTNNISSSMKEISSFCEIPESELLIKNSNRNIKIDNEDYFSCFDSSDVKNKFDKLLTTFENKH